MALAGCGSESGAPAQAQGAPPALPVTVARPVVKDIVDWDVFTGRFEATNYVEVRARVNGYLDAVHFQDGALVNKGDLLFTIDPRPYRAALNEVEAQLRSGQTQVDFTRADFDRAQALIRNGNIAEQVVDQRRQQFLAAQASVEAARAAMEAARLNLEFTEIRAPVAGRISRKLVTEGNLITADATLLTTIVSFDPIYFYFDVDEQRFLAYQRLAQRKSVAAGAMGAGGEGVEIFVGLSDEKTIDRVGRLNFVDNQIDQASGTIRARATLENDDLFLTPGLFGRIRIPASESYRAILVPDEALTADQERRLVSVVAEDGTVSSVEVRAGPLADGYRVIRSGLKGDEKIVIKGLQRARPGGKVAPEMAELPPSRDDKGW